MRRTLHAGGVLVSLHGSGFPDQDLTVQVIGSSRYSCAITQSDSSTVQCLLQLEHGWEFEYPAEREIDLTLKLWYKGETANCSRPESCAVSLKASFQRQTLDVSPQQLNPGGTLTTNMTGSSLQSGTVPTPLIVESVTYLAINPCYNTFLGWICLMQADGKIRRGILI